MCPGVLRQNKNTRTLSKSSKGRWLKATQQKAGMTGHLVRVSAAETTLYVYDTISLFISFLFSEPRRSEHIDG